MNKAELTPSLWLYAIHSKNAEIIYLLESNEATPPKNYEQCLIESIKCHHNDIVNYIENNFLHQTEIIFQRNEEIISNCLKYHNYLHFQNNRIIDHGFFYLCFYHYDKLFSLLMEKKKKSIEKKINQYSDFGIASENNEIEVIVVQSSLPRLNTAQQYIFDSVMKLFGKDIANNFVIIAIFADAGEPQVLSAIKEANIPCYYVSKFNNSALFASQDGDDRIINHLFWKIGQAGYATTFFNVNKIEPKSLSLTKRVLDERKKLQVSIECLNVRIRECIAKLEEIANHCAFIEQFKAEIKANKNFTATTKEFEPIKIDLKKGEHVTNCSHCNRTCHYPCYVFEDCKKIKCAAMNKDGYCEICGCKWDIHINIHYRIEVNEVEKVITLIELKQKYGDAKQKKQTNGNNAFKSTR